MKPQISLLNDYIVQQHNHHSIGANTKTNNSNNNNSRQQQSVKIKSLDANSLNCHQNHRNHSSCSSSSADSLPVPAAPISIAQVQRKFFAFLYVYATIVITLYVTYAIVNYYNQYQRSNLVSITTNTNNNNDQHQASSLLQVSSNQPASQVSATDIDYQLAQVAAMDGHKLISDMQAKFENKIHLLERYIEVIAIDLEATKSRLSEREKCACSINCSFNGTIFNDKQIWQQKCDTCVCQAGKISCAPKKCPKLINCDDQIQLPNQCCPICMKKCKLNKSFVRHGYEFKPLDSRGVETNKQCKCHDGLIKCESIANQKPVIQVNSNKLLPIINNNKQQTANKTVNEYLKLIVSQASTVVNEHSSSSNNNKKLQVMDRVLNDNSKLTTSG